MLQRRCLKSFGFVLLLAVLAGSACDAKERGMPDFSGVPATIKVTSPSFQDGQAIPPKYTCRGGDTSPALAWTGVPAGAKSLVLIVEDPDAHTDPAAPKTIWVHWLLL